RTTDGGQSRRLGPTRPNGRGVWSLLNRGGGVVMAGTGNVGRIFRSTDGGQSWSEAANLYPSPYRVGYVYSLVNLGDGVVIAGAAGWPTAPSAQVFRSTDGDRKSVV